MSMFTRRFNRILKPNHQEQPITTAEHCFRLSMGRGNTKERL